MDTAALANLDALPVANLGHWPTPLDRLERFGAALGTEVWIKRDDVQGVALAGNKIRKFRLAIGEALAAGCDTLVTTGAAQSNSARTGASAAAAVGMSAILLLSGDEPDEPYANLLLDHLVGAELRFAGDANWRELNVGVEAIVAELAEQGRKGFAAPVGCSSPLGSLGFALGYLELREQLTAAGVTPGAIVHTSTSGGTHAGLLVGRSLAGDQTRIIGVDAGRMYRDQQATLCTMAAKSAALIGHDFGLEPNQVEMLDTQVGRSYGRATEAGTEAINLLASTESIIVDPVYSGKGVAGLIELARAGQLDGPVVFWHTGGFHALFDPRYGTPQASAT